MIPRVLFIALALCLSAITKLNAQSESVLTNASIIELVREQFDEALIISQIETNKNTFRVGLAEMKELKAAGVSNAIISKMAAAEKDPELAFTDPNDELAPHMPGIYYKTSGKLVEFLPTNAPNTQTRAAGAIFGSAFIPVKIVAQMTGERSPNIFDPPPTLYFYFNQQATSSSFDPGRLSYFAFQTATSPREFVLAEMNVRKGKRELEIGSGNVHNSKTGLSAKQTRQLDEVQQLAPGIFKVELPTLEAGEYCIVHSAMGGWASQHQKIYDFHTNGFRASGHVNEAPPPVKRQEPVQEQRTNEPAPTLLKSSPAQDEVKPAPVPQAPVEPEVQVLSPSQPGQQVSPPTPQTQEAIVVDEPPKPLKSEATPSGSENVKSTTRPLVQKEMAPIREASMATYIENKKDEPQPIINGQAEQQRSAQQIAQSSPVKSAVRTNEQPSAYSLNVPSNENRVNAQPVVVHNRTVRRTRDRPVVTDPRNGRYRVSHRRMNEILRMEADSLRAKITHRDRNIEELNGEKADLSYRLNASEEARVVETNAAKELKQSTAYKANVEVASAPDRCVHIAEPPSRFGLEALQAYTLLHAFTARTALDTFRVITTRQSTGYKHELRISSSVGKVYTEQLFALPLESADAPSRCTDQEVEFLRVRQALSPGNFRMRPMSVSEWQRSNNRANNDFAYDVSVEEYQKAFDDQPLVGFTFQSDEVRRKMLVWSPTLGRIVNIEPETP